MNSKYKYAMQAGSMCHLWRGPGCSATFLLLAISASLIVGCDQNEALKQTNTPPAVAEAAPKPSAQDVRLMAINKHEAKAAQGDHDAQLALAKLFLDGKDATPNYARAKMLLEQAAEKGVPEANAYFGPS